MILVGQDNSETKRSDLQGSTEVLILILCHCGGSKTCYEIKEYFVSRISTVSMVSETREGMEGHYSDTTTEIYTSFSGYSTPEVFVSFRKRGLGGVPWLGLP